MLTVTIPLGYPRTQSAHSCPLNQRQQNRRAAYTMASHQQPCQLQVLAEQMGRLWDEIGLSTLSMWWKSDVRSFAPSSCKYVVLVMKAAFGYTYNFVKLARLKMAFEIPWFAAMSARRKRRAFMFECPKLVRTNRIRSMYDLVQMSHDWTNIKSGGDWPCSGILMLSLGKAYWLIQYNALCYALCLQSVCQPSIYIHMLLYLVIDGCRIRRCKINLISLSADIWQAGLRGTWLWK